MNKELPQTETEQDCVELPSYVPDRSIAESHLKDCSLPMSIEVRECDFNFKCPKKWDSLRATNRSDMRYCDACQKYVWFCKTNKELRYAVSQDRCVAVEVASPNPLLGNTVELGRFMEQLNTPKNEEIINKELPQTEAKQDCDELAQYDPNVYPREAFLKDYSLPMSIEVRACDFSFKCPKKWDSLRETNRSDVRYCEECNEHVFFCKTSADLISSVNKGRCVAVDVVSPDQSVGNKLTLGRLVDSSSLIPAFLRVK